MKFKYAPVKVYNFFIGTGLVPVPVLRYNKHIIMGGVNMKKRLLALFLVLVLALVPSASALTADQTKEILQTYYVDEIPQEALSQNTIEEILDILGDPYTDYFSAEEYAEFMGSMEDTEIVGIGISGFYLETGIYIAATAPDSPASDAGIRQGDSIIAIDGHDTRGAEESDIDSWIQGREGTQVSLTIQRGTETFSVTATRRAVVFPTVTLDKIENRVGWITCTAFGSTTFQHFYDIITTHDDEVDEWVVDLRSNGGGDVLAAVFSAGCFAGKKQGVYLRDAAGDYSAFLHDPNYITAFGYYDGPVDAFDNSGYLTTNTVFVLVDEYSASATELFCSSIRDSGAGLIIGARTYGKGVAQTIFSADYPAEYFELGDPNAYFSDGDAIKVTTERGFSTQGSTYDKVGILPHLMVDADLADEVAALLAAPIDGVSDLLTVSGLNANSQIANSFAVPLSLLTAAENADAAAALLSALPPSVSCTLAQGGSTASLTAADAAAQLGLSYTSRAFSDTAGTPYQREIDTLGTFGIVSGSGNGGFQPDQVLDRASLCALLVKAMRYPMADGQTEFADVPADAWYAPYVDTLYEMGLVNGYDDGLFHPNDPINHEQFLVLMARIAKWLDMDYYEMSLRNGAYGNKVPAATTLAMEYGSFSAWARESVWLAGHFAWTDHSNIAPQASTTRAEAAATLFNLFWSSGVLNNT